LVLSAGAAGLGSCWGAISAGEGDGGNENSGEGNGEDERFGDVGDLGASQEGVKMGDCAAVRSMSCRARSCTEEATGSTAARLGGEVGTISATAHTEMAGARVTSGAASPGTAVSGVGEFGGESSE
jgi:hypothetical protein